MGMTVGGNQPIAVDKAAEDRLGLQKIVNAQKKTEPPKAVTCQVCGKTVTTNMFCPECGTRLFCPTCGKRVEKTNYCPKCGTKLQ